MKNISIFKGKPKKLEALFFDGYLTNIIWDGEKYRLEGKQLKFDTIQGLSDHYKGCIRSLREIPYRVTDEAYTPKFLSWCKSLEQETKELRGLILGNPVDVAQLKQEYRELTGKQFRRKPNE